MVLGQFLAVIIDRTEIGSLGFPFTGMFNLFNTHGFMNFLIKYYTNALFSSRIYSSLSSYSYLYLALFLRFPEDVIKVCMWSEAKIRQFISKNGLFPCNIKSLNILTSAILKMLLHYPGFESLKEHSKEQNVQDNHMFYLVRLISNTYLNIRMHYTTKMKTEKLHDVKVRQHLLKTTLFKGQ